VREWLSALDESFEGWDIELVEIHERDEVVVVLSDVHARGRGSGLELDMHTGWVVEFAGDQVKRLRIFRDHDEALAAGGLNI
jgi:ketosteroid isomerase-like protein